MRSGTLANRTPSLVLTTWDGGSGAPVWLPGGGLT